jgi:hypothetical protein
MIRDYSELGFLGLSELLGLRAYDFKANISSFPPISIIQKIPVQTKSLKSVFSDQTPHDNCNDKQADGKLNSPDYLFCFHGFGFYGECLKYKEYPGDATLIY